MKKCAIIACYINNQYRKDLLQKQVNFFNKLGIDSIIVSSDHVDKVEGAKNYITISHVSEKKYITDNLFSCMLVDGLKYYKQDAYSNISAKSFFIKLFHCSFEYCKRLGYDFCYILDFDNTLNPDHNPIAFGENLNLSKVYFYNFDKESEYQGGFFYGNLALLSDIFSDKNLERLENEAKNKYVYTNEQAYFLLADQYKDDVCVLSNTPYEIYSKRNEFSSSNVADVYYNSNTNEYWFLHMKGDRCDNEFSCELLLDDAVIYHNKLSEYGTWIKFKLENERNYTIKYYDNDVSPNTLSKVTKIYTDSSKPSVKNWIE